MGSLYDVIDARMAGFLSAQPVFCVATAPLDAAGRVNCSPKGNDGTFAVLGDPRLEGLMTNFAVRSGARAVIVVDVERISDSCGYAVPLMEFQGHRDNLDHWVETKGGEQGRLEYRAEKNAFSGDGLPGLEARVSEAPLR